MLSLLSPKTWSDKIVLLQSAECCLRAEMRAELRGAMQPPAPPREFRSHARKLPTAPPTRASKNNYQTISHVSVSFSVEHF